MSSRYFAIIPHPTQPNVLISHTPIGWTLPQLTPAGDFYAYVTTLAEQAEERFGIPVTILRCSVVCAESESETQSRQGLFVCENRSTETAPPSGCRWISRDELGDLSGLLPPIRFALEKWFVEADDPESISSERTDWARPGWFADTKDWIYRTLAAKGITPTGSMEQIKTWSISCLMRLPTNKGIVYFKAVSSVFATEPQLTVALAERFPGETVEVLAADTARQCFLMRELTGGSLRDAEKQEPEAGLSAAALRRFSAMQIACIGQDTDMVEWGCRSRPLSQLPDDMGELLAELDNPEKRTIYGLTEKDALELRRHVSGHVATLCAELASFGLPETLLHGDLHGGNVWVSGEGNDRHFVFFDWSDGAIAHPFFDLVTFLDLPDSADKAAMARYGETRDAYLEAWTAYLPLEELTKAFTVAQKLAPAYHAVSYRHIAQATEPAAQWELSPAVGHYLRKLLN